MHITSLSDQELISRYTQTDDKELVGELYKRHSMFVFGVCRKYLKDDDQSKDAAMQIFEKLLSDLKKHNIQNFKAWLHIVTKNHCLMQLRSPNTYENKHVAFEENYIPDMESAEPLHPENAKEQMLTHLEEAMQELSEKQKHCIRLFYLDNKSYDEVAEETGFTMNEVKSFIQNGKRNLKIIISKKMNWISVVILFFETLSQIK